MALQKGAKLLFDWLGEQRAGTVVTYDAVMSATNWAEVSLRTYINKNKVAPFLQRLPGRKLKILLDGDDITEQFFNETFTQTAPRPITLVSGQTLHGRKGGYTLIEHIDNGAVGHVWSARATSGSMLVAAKVMLPRQDLLRSSQLPNVRRRFRREARCGETFEHPNVIRYLDSGDVEKNPFLIMELAESSVADRLARSKPISEGQSAEIVAGCIAGLCFLHEQTCVHRDVKPANDDSDALIERFGGDESPEERAQARTSAPALIDTAPDRCCWPSSPGHRAPGAAARSAGIPVRKPPKLRDAGHAGGWIPHLAQCRHVAVGADATILHEVLTSRGLHGQPQAHAPFRAQSALR